MEPFHRCTLEREGHRNNGVLYDLLPTMDTLLEYLETAKHSYKVSNSASHLIQSIELAWEKLNKYYSTPESNAVLYAAVVLHPGMKYDYFESNWAEL